MEKSPSRNMDSRAKLMALKVMTEFMTHPLTLKFHSPMIREGSEPKNDNLDLSIIKNKIQNEAYKTVGEWLADIESVWSNAENTFNDDVHSSVVNECRRIFETIIRKSGIYPFQDWCRDVFDLEKRYQRKLQDAPLKVRQASAGQKPKKRENKFSDEELSDICDMYKSLTPSERIDVVVMLIETEDYPGLGKDVVCLDLDSMRTPVVDRLKKFIEDLLKKRGVVLANEENDNDDDDDDDDEEFE